MLKGIQAATSMRLSSAPANSVLLGGGIPDLAPVPHRTCSSRVNSFLKREIYQNNTVVRLILNDEKRRNALSLAMVKELTKELTEINSIKKIRSVIIAAEGKVFSSGHDLKELVTQTSESGAEKHVEIFERSAQLMQLIHSMQQPVIAEVGGLAAAAGCQLVASCDIVVASATASFIVPGQKVGLFCSTPSVPLTRSVSPKVALDMLLTARPIDAQVAHSVGLVSRVVEKEGERVEALRVAEQIAAFSAETTSLGKAFFYSQQGLPIAHAYRIATRVMTENLKMADAKEGIAAFIEKRSPKFSSSS